jgi:hypothetical protein
MARWPTCGFAPGPIGAYDLVPLDTAAALIEEARAMKHCVRAHSGAIARGAARVWSVRRDGERVATLMVGWRLAGAVLDVADLRGPLNAPVAADLWAEVIRWTLAQGVARTTPEAMPSAAPDRRIWTRLWRPYWLAKRRFPPWLPLAPEPGVLWRIDDA